MRVKEKPPSRQGLAGDLETMAAFHVGDGLPDGRVSVANNSPSPLRTAYGVGELPSVGGEEGSRRKGVFGGRICVMKRTDGLS